MSYPGWQHHGAQHMGTFIVFGSLGLWESEHWTVAAANAQILAGWLQ